MKIVAISPRPSDDEAAAITIALARLHAERGAPELRSDRYSRASLSALHPDLGRASLGTPQPDPERRLSWRETARLEALDGGV